MATRQDISDQAYADFMAQTEGWHLDLAALPTIQERKAKERPNNGSGSDFTDERFSPAPQKEKSPAAYRKDLVRFANENARDVEIARVLGRGGVLTNSGGPEGRVFFRISATGEEIEVETRRVDGLWQARVNGETVKSPTRDGLLFAISRALNNRTRELTEGQRREISIICQSPEQGFYRGVARYVSLKTGMPESEVLSDSAVLDNRNASIFDEAVSFCFLAIHGDFSPGPDWNEFLADYARGRHYNFALCEGARAAYLEQAKQAAREELLSAVSVEPQPEESPAPTYQQLDALNDEEISQHLRSTKREMAKQIRAGLM